MEKGDQSSLLIKSLLSGGLAGMAGKSFVAPLDRVKILMQTQNIHYKGSGVWTCLVGVVQREGFLGLYRANGVQMLRVFPYGAIQFASYEAIKKLLDDGRQDSRRHWRKLVAGSVGGVCGVVVTYPLDTLRAHLAFHSKCEVKHSGMMQSLRTVTKQEGWRGLYRGLAPAVVAVVPHAGLTFYFFELLKSGLILRFDLLRTQASHEESYSLSVSGKLLAGGAAGAMAQSVCYPLDVARRRMQLGHGGNTVKVLLLTLQANGLSRGLYRGMSVNYIRAIPLNAVSFSAYESLKEALGVSTCLKMD